MDANPWQMHMPASSPTIRASHDRDFRSLAVLPLQELEDCRLIVIRADYKGDVVVETVTGTMAGAWLGAPDFDLERTWLSSSPHGLGSERFPGPMAALRQALPWLHDQEPAAAGATMCRLCKGRKSIVVSLAVTATWRPWLSLDASGQGQPNHRGSSGPRVFLVLKGSARARA